MIGDLRSCSSPIGRAPDARLDVARDYALRDSSPPASSATMAPEKAADAETAREGDSKREEGTAGEDGSRREERTESRADDVAKGDPEARCAPDGLKDFEGDLGDVVSPVRELNAALNERREAEKRAFDELIRENARLERAIRKTEARHAELLAKDEVKSIELDAERAKNAKLEGQLSEMRQEMTSLIKAAKKAGMMRAGSRGDRDGDGARPDREHSGTSSADSRRKQKIAELEERLLQFSDEDERKSRRLIALERELLNRARYVEALERHVDDDVREQIARQVEPAEPEIVFTAMGKVNNTVYPGRAETYSYKNNVVQDSAVCSIS